MKRALLADLLRWKQDPKRKPLVVRGARQVGKTWLLRALGQTYTRTVYVNFESSAAARRLFRSEDDLTVERILRGIALLDGGGPLDPAQTLLIFDEIQAAPFALSSLKYFAEQAPNVHLACAGSLLGVAMHAGSSFPVGKITFLDLRPMSFAEVLRADGRDDIACAIETGELDLVSALHEELTTRLRWYTVLGGMPEIVAHHLEHQDIEATRKLQADLLDAYDHDFSKHAPAAQVPKIRAIYKGLVGQLGKENRKFVYGQIREGARAKDLELALQWLIDAGLVHRVDRTGTPRLPLAAYRDSKAFKLYAHDVGLLARMADLDPKVIAFGDELFTEYKGALTEQLALQELLTTGVPTPHYWSHEAGTAEVDFLVQLGNRVLPIEVKATTNLKAKSLRVYREKYHPEIAVRLSLAPYEAQSGLTSLPLYAIAAMPHLSG